MILLLLAVLGILIWFLAAEINKDDCVEPARMDACRGCHRHVDRTWSRCPYCHAALKVSCPVCHHKKRLTQSYCPLCGTREERRR